MISANAKINVVFNELLFRFVSHSQSVFGDGENTKVRVSELEEEVRTLKKINKDLYEFSTQLLTKPN